MNERYRRLLMVAVVLAGLRFGVVPWLDWQAAQHDRLQVVSQRLDKSEALLKNTDLLMPALQKIEDEVRQLREPFPSGVREDQFKRESQQQITALVESLGLTVDYFDWLDAVEAPAGLSGQRARFTISGGMRDLALMQGELESKISHLFVSEVSYRFSGVIAGAWPTPSAITISADLYYVGETS